MQKAFIGVDLHSNNFTACYLREKTPCLYRSFELTENGLSEFIISLSSKDEIALEATSNVSFFHNKIENYVKNIVVVAPYQFSVIGKSTKKNDKLDAKELAYFLFKNMLPKARIKSELSSQILSLVSTREILIKSKVSLIAKLSSILIQKGRYLEKNKLNSKNVFSKYIYVDSNSWNATEKVEFKIIENEILSLRKSIDILELEIETLAKRKKGYKNSISIKGIGPLSAAIILSVIDNIEDFSKSQNLASYFGVVPIVRESNGKRSLGRITKKGSKIGRKTLVQCTWIAKRYNSYLNDFYERIKKRSGTKKAIVACSRKFLVIIYDTLKNDWEFEDFSEFKMIRKKIDFKKIRLEREEALKLKLYNLRAPKVKQPSKNSFGTL